MYVQLAGRTFTCTGCTVSDSIIKLVKKKSLKLEVEAYEVVPESWCRCQASWMFWNLLWSIDLDVEDIVHVPTAYVYVLNHVGVQAQTGAYIASRSQRTGQPGASEGTETDLPHMYGCYEGGNVYSMRSYLLQGLHIRSDCNSAEMSHLSA